MKKASKSINYTVDIAMYILHNIIMYFTMHICTYCTALHECYENYPDMEITSLYNNLV